MNIPQIYLVEPYNAYAPKQKKKHWMQEVEEQALLARIIAEQTALQEAAAKRTSNTLPPQAPDTATPTIVGSSAGEGAAGGKGSGAGGGGSPPPEFFHPEEDVVNFSFTPAGGAAPLTIVFTNLTTTPQLDSYLWVFGDGTTSTDINPTHVYQSGSTAVPYTCSLQVTNSVTGVPGGSNTQFISASIPVVTAKFTYVTSSGTGPVTASFTNTSTNTSQTPTTTYLWTFGDTTSSSLASPPVHPYANTGSFTASLQATGSYGIETKYTQSFFVPAPTLQAAFTYVTSSAPGPVTASFTDASAYNGHGTLIYKWVFGDTTTSSLAAPVHPYSNTGSFTASLQVTESTYAIKSSVTSSFYVTAPVLTAGFTFTTSSKTAPSIATFVNTINGVGGTQYNGHGFLTYLWNLGSGSLTAITSIPTPTTYTVAGGYTASLQVTESNYGLSSSYAVSWSLA